jgi:hypothetical protein
MKKEEIKELPLSCIVYALYEHELVLYHVHALSLDHAKMLVAAKIRENGWGKPDRLAARRVLTDKVVTHLWTMHSKTVAFATEETQ